MAPEMGLISHTRSSTVCTRRVAFGFDFAENLRLRPTLSYPMSGTDLVADLVLSTAGLRNQKQINSVLVQTVLTKGEIAFDFFGANQGGARTSSAGRS